MLLHDGAFRHIVKTIDAVPVRVRAQSTVFKWKVLGRSITLMLIECVVMFAVVLALQRASADSDPFRSLARLTQRHVSRAVAKLRWLVTRVRVASRQTSVSASCSKASPC
jgi:hypothetical protein